MCPQHRQRPHTQHVKFQPLYVHCSVALLLIPLHFVSPELMKHLSTHLWTFTTRLYFTEWNLTPPSMPHPDSKLRKHSGFIPFHNISRHSLLNKIFLFRTRIQPPPHLQPSLSIMWTQQTSNSNVTFEWLFNTKISCFDHFLDTIKGNSTPLEIDIKASTKSHSLRLHYGPHKFCKG